MNRILRYLFSLSLIPIWNMVLSSGLHASFENIGSGARAAGLGNAFVSLADDVYALYGNPSGLVYLKQKEFSSTYGLLHTGLRDGSKIRRSTILYGHPLKEKIGTFGFSWQQLSSDNLYKERIFILGYGRRIAQKWAVGINLKQYHRRFSPPVGQTNDQAVTDLSKSDPLFGNGDSRSNIGMDLGFLYRPYRNISYGMTFENLNEPNMALSETDNDSVPMTVKLGMAAHRKNTTLLSELVTRKSIGDRRDYVFTTAAEKWWPQSGFAHGDTALRTSVGFGSRKIAQTSLGFSHRLNSFQFDYGFIMPLTGLSFGTSDGNHRLTLTLRFGDVIVEPDYGLRTRSAEISAKRAHKKLKKLQKESGKLREELRILKEKAEKRKSDLEDSRRLAAKKSARQRLSAQLTKRMDRYWRQKSSGASLTERADILSGILKEFSRSGLDLSSVKKELAWTSSARKKAEKDLAISWSYYRKIAARGITIPERIHLLNQMVVRFSKTGADLTPLMDELRSLKKTAPAP